MPRGVWKRTKKHLEDLQRNLEKAWKLPITEKQLEARRENGRKVGNLPCTEAEREASRRNAYKMSQLPKTRKQIEAHRSKKANVIAKHHNDLCHGALRPNDITCMTMSEHSFLHSKIRVENGTHNWLKENKQ